MREGLDHSGGRENVWHNGGTGGYCSFIGFDPKGRTGVVVLSNMSTETGVDDIGGHLLDSLFPLSQPRKEVAVSPEIFDRYVGKYELARNFILDVTRVGNRLFVQATGQPKLELLAESDQDFFLKGIDAQISFQSKGQERAASLILHQGGDQLAKRIE